MNTGFRRLLPSEHRACFVGSGECFIPAAYETDDGSGGFVYVCPFHRVEFERTEKMFAELAKNNPSKYEQLEAHVEDAYQKHQQQQEQNE